MKHLLTLIFSFVAIQFAYSQKQIHIVDSLTGKGLPFATIECFEKKWGLYTDSAGFANIPENMLQEKHKVSYVGYQSKEMTIQTTNSIALCRLPEKLQDVTVISCKETNIEKLEVIIEKHTTLGFSMKSFGYSWAVFLPNSSNKEGKLLSITYEAKGKKEAKPDAPYRLRFFEYDSIKNLPSNELTFDDILVAPKVLNKEVTEDLSKYNITVPANGIIVSFEAFDAGSQFYYKQMITTLDNKRKEIEEYGWQINATYGLSIRGFGRTPGNYWLVWNNFFGKNLSVAPLIKLEIKVCK